MNLKMTEQEKIIEKIKKLLALEHEAKLAMEKAQNLIKQYCINISEVEKEPIIQKLYNFRFKGINERKYEKT